MKNIFRNILNKFYYVFVFCPIIMLGANNGNIASQLANQVNSQVEEAGKSIASIVNTIAIVMGALWIVIMLLLAFFNIEAIKNHSKLLFGAVVIIGVIYGLSNAMM